jgi:hypothetical protein
MMLDVFHIVSHGFRRYSEKLQQVTQSAMTLLDVPCHGLPFRREREAAIAFIVHVTPLGEPSHHIRNGRTVELQGVRDIRHPRVSFGFDQFLDPLEMILRGL